MAGKALSYWLDTAPQTGFAPLSGDLRVDVAIVGGGIVGLSTAALLKQDGRSVAVLEARRVGRQATGHSTAKLTAQHATIYAGLVRTHGRDGARLYAEANQAAIARVERFVRELAIDCDFERRDAYVFSGRAEAVAVLEEESARAGELGLPAAFLRDPPMPLPAAAAVRFADQAQFHPCKYLAGLAAHVDGGGCHVFEESRALEVEAGPTARVHTGHGSVSAGAVVVATQLPIVNKGMYFAKAYPRAEPMLAAPVAPARAPDGMFFCIDEPTLSLIRAPNGGQPYLIAAGGQHKPGEPEAAAEALATLERRVRESFGIGEIAYRWSNQDYWPMDGVPFVGAAGERGPLVATGFRAWGLSNGTAAAMMLADRIAGRPNPWAGLFDAGRAKPAASASAFVSGNVEVAGHLLGGYLARRTGTPEALAPGEAGVFSRRGKPVAAYRDPAGALHRLSAVCTHMKCVVGWNPVDRDWACPCHGSRFGVDGAVIRGPAVTPLAPVDGD